MIVYGKSTQTIKEFEPNVSQAIKLLKRDLKIYVIATSVAFTVVMSGMTAIISILLATNVYLQLNLRFEGLAVILGG